ncbi:Protein of unknown function [Pyronema omphalodes CBS 100304]|uniref:Uncharacterized protein n=1 Tax=Pyronema omphalodes (strain CBS 100304) TaxID=1076935 RepID=U4LWC4_PYROM|nr:Protein of unknown function [Pyronema omphalodes CBS 100304]
MFLFGSLLNGCVNRSVFFIDLWHYFCFSLSP